MNESYLSLGSNEGDRLSWFKKAIELLGANCGTISKRSSIYETSAWGITDQPDFLNMVVALKTTLSPSELLTEILKIETSLGRQRSIKWGPRTLDIDILLYNNDIIELPGLTIPHPYLHERRFTLLPLAEVAGQYIHPVLNRTIADLLRSWPDQLDVRKMIERPI
jgi:2-amino-4-hydroxy-6-hydroxymethyldihydropteridine diphosphokinase